MFHPLPLFIGLRYFRTRKQGFFVSFISWVSMLGIAIGVAALITVLSVMNGFEGELRGRLLSLASHATLSGSPDRLADWRALLEQAATAPGVVGAAPFVELQAMVGRGQTLSGAILRGIDPEFEPAVSSIAGHMIEGQLSDLVPGAQRIVLGAGLAWALDARIGDEIIALVPQVGDSTDVKPRIQNFTVAGLFEVGLQEHDNGLALVHIEDAAALAGTGGAPTGLRLKFADIFAAPTLAPEVARALGGDLVVSDWSRENASYFRAVRIEKTMMSLILMLIVAVAAFNIVAALVMVVNEKRNDIAILRTVGLAPRGVVGIFLTQGIVIGWLGTLAGVALGLTLAFNVAAIVPALETAFGTRVMDPTVYYITEVPSEVRWVQVAIVSGVAFVLTALATVYPSLRGARTEPAEALRYE
ncbi:MAG TPA: lipoprotein-releasing ABC transporter permease subunit [Steroidobacteraceae bacterium]|nr:lipoprotein-releasing ABC transporter permease subunit [Steroidobacteraceae bacterium]